MNLRSVADRELYRVHRAHLMELLGAHGRGGDLCVFGAGNCSDIDLEQLTGEFGEVHLVDLDGDALERARERVPLPSRDRIVIHPEVDLSGFVNRLDEWSEGLPLGELGPRAVAAAHEIVRDLGRQFELTLSACVLSQLTVPFRRAWARSAFDWANIEAATTAVHVATVAGATRPGRRGLFAFDVLSSKAYPALAEHEGEARRELASFVDRQRRQGEITLSPDPEVFVSQLGAPGLASLVSQPTLTTPWLWNLGDAVQLVYGLVFRRP
jgi:hypothetical protein